ncbi:MAG TPA: hypothetical protein VHL11_12035 [Phototrophicaceae bacterium]|jgi:hypothetical protein|nr:hypothetical protein [Phototrophicaceae bacterium]
MSSIQTTHLNLKVQVLRVWFPVLLNLALVAVIITVTVIITHFIQSLHLADPTYDPSSLFKRQFYYDLLDYIDLAGWAAAANLCLLGVIFSGESPMYSTARRFLVVSVFLNGLFLLDEVFMLHMHVLPHLLGLSTTGVMGGFGLLAAVYLLAFRRYILTGTDYLPLIAAFMLLGGALLLDLIVSASAETIILGDGLKRAGIIFWVIYFGRTVFPLTRAVYL